MSDMLRASRSLHEKGNSPSGMEETAILREYKRHYISAIDSAGSFHPLPLGASPHWGRAARQLAKCRD